MTSRRDILRLFGIAGLVLSKVAESVAATIVNPVRVRTITAGVELTSALELDRVERAVAFLTRTQRAFSDCFSRCRRDAERGRDDCEDHDRIGASAA